MHLGFPIKKIKFAVEQATKIQRGISYTSAVSLTSGLDGVGGERHAPATLLLGKTLSTRCTGDWMGPRAVLKGAEDLPSPNRESILVPCSP